MVNIFSGHVQRRALSDTNITRLQDFNVNRFSKTILQSASQAQREESVKKGFEFHQAMMADLQTKLGEITEKLNNLYRRYIEKAVFKKVTLDDYGGTSSLLNTFPSVDDPSGMTGHPAGTNDILPYDDPQRIRNYSYNPFFGSKAMDETDQNVMRTKYETTDDTLENAYREYGSFWASVSYLWGWDVDRINASYATTIDNPDTPGFDAFDAAGGQIDDTTLQINVTAVQPNRPQLPPLRTGDRFPFRPAQYPVDPTAFNFPNVGVQGIRPGGADYNHATNTAGVNDVATDSLNFGWEFDDLPVALEVTGVTRNSDGTTTPTGYKVVYDIPISHPKYDQYRLLDGTEPQILDAPTQLVKQRINNESFDYIGTIALGDGGYSGTFESLPGDLPATTNDHATFDGTSGETVTDPIPLNLINSTVGTFTYTICHDTAITSATEVTFDYNFTVLQNQLNATIPTPSDDGLPGHSGMGNAPFWTRHDWNGTGAIVNQAVGGGTTITLGSVATSEDSDPLHNPTDGTGSSESLKLRFYNPGGNNQQVAVDVIFDGDINSLNVNITDLQITNYTGQGIDNTGGSWEQGLFTNGAVDLGATSNLPVQADPNDVINKYQNDRFQFTQFQNTYNYSDGGAITKTNLGDIVRSPFEYGLLNIQDDAGNSADLGGDLFIDLNTRRLNLEYNGTPERVDDLTVQPDYEPGATFGLTGAGSAAVQTVYNFVNPTHPGDVCVPSPNPDPSNHATQISESDPYMQVGPGAPPGVENHYTDTGTYGDKTTQYALDTGPIQDPLRTVNPGWGNPGTYYGGGYTGGANNDTTNTVDRVTGSDDMNYTVAIPTTDVNILRKDNNLTFNLGSIEDRDFAIDVNEPFMEFRTITDYRTMPRYRVDNYGNIFDRFGKGYYNAGVDAAALATLYPTNQVNAAVSALPLNNGQISNADDVYDSDGNYDPNDAAGHRRLSQVGDDLNLFDYVPDLEDDPTVSDPDVLRGEIYAGSLPSNFYYYRENLDNSGANAATGDPTGAADPTGLHNFNGDSMAALNFDSRRINMDGEYDVNHTYVTNPNVPAWANVTMGYAEQHQKWNTQTLHDTTFTWVGFRGLGEDTQGVTYIPTADLNGITLPESVALLGKDVGQVTQFDHGDSLVVDMFSDSSSAGHLQVYESYVKADPNSTTIPPTTITVVEPHAVPLPLEPGYTYTFESYVQKKTMTRTGSTNQILHVDDGIAFITPPPTPAGNITIEVQNTATSAWTQMVIDMTSDVDVTTHPHVIRLPAALPFVPGPDTPVRMVPPEFTVEVRDAPGTDPQSSGLANSQFIIGYNNPANPTPTLQGSLASIELSPEMDRVGTGIGDDARTAAVETDFIAPEVYDTPHGYIQPDASFALNLVSQDASGNPRPRKLRNIRITVDSGEQIIMGTAGAISQLYNTDGPYNTTGTWPIGIFEDDTQLNNQPASAMPTGDLDIYVGHYQGIVSGQTGNGGAGAPLFLTSVLGFKINDKVTIDGEQRYITAIDGVTNTITLDQPLTNSPSRGIVSINNGLGTRGLEVMLNRSFAMSSNSPVSIELDWEELDVQGYPPTTTASATPARYTQTMGFTQANPSVDPTVADTNFDDHDYIVAGEGRAGGSFDNEFTNELKRIIDDPSYAELFRHNLFKNVFIAAAVNDPFSDLVAGKFLLDWDRRRRRVSLLQTSYMAFFKSG